MRVCMVIPEYFPVPAVKGGAVETLAQSILDENEKNNKIDIVCVTKYDKKASKLYNNYKHTKFIPIKYFDRYSPMGRITAFFNYGIRAIFKYDIRKQYRIKKYKEILPATNSDLYVFEGENQYTCDELTNLLGKDKMVLHLHKTYEPNKEWENQFQHFIAISNYVKEKFIGGNEIDGNRISVVYNGIKIEKFDKDVSEDEICILKDKYKIDKDKKIIIYTGRLFKEKGVKELIKAFKICKSKANSILLICGGGMGNNNKSTDYINELKRLSENENIIFTGYIDNKELFKYYKASDIAVFPSLWEEGFGNVVIEAMVCKLPVIISNRGGMKELVSEETGIKVDLNDNFVDELSYAIDNILSDETVMDSLSKNAYAFSKGFSEEKYYIDYTNTCTKFYEKITNKG